MKEGLSGNIAKSFISSKLTILLMIAFLLTGAFSIMLIPREEEPQIDVPIADIYVGFPGAEPKEVETKLTAPLEKIVSNFPESYFSVPSASEENSGVPRGAGKVERIACVGVAPHRRRNARPPRRG